MQLDQQPGEEHAVHAGPDRKLQIGALAGGGAARIDVDDLGAPPLAVGLHPLIEHGMTPGRVGADEDDEVRLVRSS